MWFHFNHLTDITFHLTKYYVRLMIPEKKTQFWKYNLPYLNCSNKKILSSVDKGISKGVNMIQEFPSLLNVTPQNVKSKLKTILTFS